MLSNPAARSALGNPVVVWEAGTREMDIKRLDTPTPPLPFSIEGDEAVLTSPGGAQTRPRQGEPLVFEIKKGNIAGNALALGITLGRTPNNDICIPDESVSRFHGYFRQDAKTSQWTVVDVGSLNGIQAGGEKLVTDRPHVLAPREELVIGRVPVVFMLPELLLAYLDSLIKD